MSRHVNLVYSVALRHVGDTHQAEEITQAVFVVLVKKGRSLGPKVVISGWLFHAARLMAFNCLRNEIRRTRREQEAYMQSQQHENETGDIWRQVAPLLDRAIASLGETDRNAIMLRFVEGRDLKAVGAALGTNEEAAKKRVSRAVEKLHGFFIRNGVVLSGTALASIIAANAAQAAPAGLASSAMALATSKGAAGISTTTLIKGTLKLMTWTKMKIAVGLGVTLLLVAGGGVALSLVGTRPGELTAAEIVKQVGEKYASLTSYQDTGNTLQEGQGAAVNGTFTIRLGRPNLYRLEVQQMHVPPLKGAAWSAGEGDFALPPSGSKYYKFDGSGAALTAVAAFNVPLIFFNTGSDALLHGSDISRGKDEKLGGVDCLVLSCKVPVKTASRTLTLWVGRQDFLIHQWRMIIKPTKAAMIEEGGPPVMTVTETHENISVNGPLTKADFAYQPPANAVLSSEPWQLPDLSNPGR